MEGNPNTRRDLVQKRHDQIDDAAKVSTNPHERLLGPKKLFILKDPASRDMHGFDLVDIEDWKSYQQQHGVKYIFIGYTAMQFGDDDDILALHSLAERAARDAGAGAFWCASECLNHNDGLDVRLALQLRRLY